MISNGSSILTTLERKAFMGVRKVRVLDREGFSGARREFNTRGIGGVGFAGWKKSKGAIPGAPLLKH